MLQFVIFGLPGCSDYHKILSKQVKFQVIAKHTQEESLAVGVSNWLNQEPVCLFNEQISEKHELNSADLRITPITEKNIDGNIHKFVMTDETGKRIYCSWQTYYEKGEIILSQTNNSFLNFRKRQPTMKVFHLPKKICLLSAQPLFQLHEEILNIYSSARRSPSLRTILLSHYQVYSCQRDSWDQISLNMKDGTEEKYVVSGELLFSFLMSLISYYQISPYKSHLLQFQFKYERRLQIRPTINSLYTPLFELPKQKLSLKTFESLLTAVLLEKQIIVFSSQTNNIVELFEFIFDLIKPFQWQLTFIPVLTQSMFEMADSFMPYIFGIDSKHQSQFQEDFDLNGKVIINLDLDSIDFGPFQLPQLSEKVKRRISEAYLKNCTTQNEYFELKHLFINIFIELCQKLRQGLIKNEEGKAIFSQELFLKKVPLSEAQFYMGLSSTMMFTIFRQKVERILNNDPNSHDQNQKLVNDYLRLLFLKRAHNEPQTTQQQTTQFIEAKLDRIKRIYENPIRLSLYNNLIKYLYRVNHLHQPYVPYHTFINIFEQATTVRTDRQKPATATQKIFMTKKYITHNSKLR